jgi:hypothetical protein
VTSPWRPMALQRLGVVQALEGQFADGRLALEEAVLLTGGVKSTAAFSLSYLALISLHEGDEEEAFRIAQRAHAIADRPACAPNEANVLEPAMWRLELLIAGDNIRAARSFVTVTFDGTWPDPESPGIWEHFLVHGPSPEISQPPEDETRLNEVHA